MSVQRASVSVRTALRAVETGPQGAAGTALPQPPVAAPCLLSPCLRLCGGFNTILRCFVAVLQCVTVCSVPLPPLRTSDTPVTPCFRSFLLPTGAQRMGQEGALAVNVSALCARRGYVWVAADELHTMVPVLCLSVLSSGSYGRRHAPPPAAVVVRLRAVCT